MHFSAQLSSCAASRTKAFLAATPPYFGLSEKRDSATVKAAGAKWQREKKSWYAPDMATVLALLRTEAWVPFLPNSCVPFERGAETSKLTKELTRRLSKTHGKTSLPHLLPSQQDASCETVEHERKRTRRELQIEDDEPHFLEAIGSHLTAEELEDSAFVTELGPRSGLSNARRVHRGVLFLNLMDWQTLRLRIAETRRNDAPPRPTQPHAFAKNARSSAPLRDKHKSAEPEQDASGSRLCISKVPAKRQHMGCVRVECGRCGGAVDTAQQFVACKCDEWIVCSQCGGLARALDSGWLALEHQFSACKCH